MLAIPFFGHARIKDRGQESVEKGLRAGHTLFKKAKHMDISGARYPKELEVATFCISGMENK